MDEKQSQELQEMLEKRLNADYTKFRTQGIMIGWHTAHLSMLDHIKSLRYKRDIVVYLEAEVKRIEDKLGLSKTPPEDTEP